AVGHESLGRNPVGPYSFMSVEDDLKVLEAFHAWRNGGHNGGAVYEVLHRNEKAIDEKSVLRREIKVRVRHVLVDGKARNTDRNDGLGPSWTALLVVIASKPFDRQSFTTHRRDEIANPKVL